MDVHVCSCAYLGVCICVYIYICVHFFSSDFETVVLGTSACAGVYITQVFILTSTYTSTTHSLQGVHMYYVQAWLSWSERGTVNP